LAVISQSANKFAPTTALFVGSNSFEQCFGFDKRPKTNDQKHRRS